MSDQEGIHLLVKTTIHTNTNIVFPGIQWSTYMDDCVYSYYSYSSHYFCIYHVNSYMEYGDILMIRIFLCIYLYYIL